MSALPIPDGFQARADRAQDRLLDRQAPPRIRIERGEDGWSFTSPYDGDTDGAWFVLLCDAFGTRHGSVVEHFLNCIIELVPAGDRSAERDGRHYWFPDEVQFNAVLAIISALQPENEAQAAHAAQLAALHLSSMKLAQHLTSYADHRTAAILAKTSRAYGDGMERLARLQGKITPRTTHQTFEVHKHEHVHFERGAAPNGGQPHGADGSAVVSRAALPSPRSNGVALPMPCREGQAGVPRPWWGSRLWRALWQAKR